MIVCRATDKLSYSSITSDDRYGSSSSHSTPDLATGGLRPEPAAQYDPLLLFVSAFTVPWIFAEERYEQEDKSCKEAGEKHKVELDTAGL